MYGKEFLQLTSFREKMGRISQEQVARYMSEVFPPLREAHMEAIEAGIRGDSPVLLDRLKETRRDLERRNRITISRPRLSAEAVTNLAKGYALRARAAVDKNNLPDFKFNYDVSFGLGTPVAYVGVAEEQARGTFGRDIAEVIPVVAQATNLMDSSAGGQAQRYVAHMKAADIGVQLLIADPTGVDLIKSWVDKFRETPSYAIHPSQSQEFVLAGGELTIDVYKGFYQIAEPLYPATTAK